MCVGISNPQIAPKAGISAGDDQRAEIQLVSWSNGAQPIGKRLASLRVVPFDRHFQGLIMVLRALYGCGLHGWPRRLYRRKCLVG